MKFSIGDKIVERSLIRAHTSYPVYQVVGILDGNVLATHWGDGFDGELHHYDFYDDEEPGSRSWRGAIQRYQESELFTPEEALAELRRLESAKSKLEMEFDAVKEVLKGKLDLAAKLADEAADLAVKHNKTFENVVDECVPLYKALKKGGWRHSTLQCKVG